MPVHYTKMSLKELRETRAPKYDVMFKMVFTLEGSSLRTMLSIPEGLALSEEFPDLDGLRIDTLTLDGGQLHHLEFQAKNHPEMLYRMFQYRTKILDRPDIKSLREHVPLRLDQQVLYVGKPKMAMARELVREGQVLFAFKLNDIREFNEERSSLASSRFPEDWVLSLLVASDVPNNDSDWLEVARRMGSELDVLDPATAEFRTILLIASILRDVDAEIQEEISKMIEIDVSRNRLLRQIFEQGMDAAYPVFLVERIKKSVRRNELTLESALLRHIEEASPEEIEAFADDLEDAEDKQAFLDARNLGLSSNQNGNDFN